MIAPPDQIAPELATVIEAARRLRRRNADDADRALLATVDLRPVMGGFNNTVYTFTHNHETLCLKFYRVDDRRRTEREWQALRLLESWGETVAPRPIACQWRPHAPAIVMEQVDGESLGERSLGAAQLAAVLAARQRLYARTPALVDQLLPTVVGDVPAIVRRVASGEKALTLQACSEVEGAAQAVLRAWLRGPEPGSLLQPAPLVFASGDGNLANCLWDGTSVRLVDFEYSGWSDRAFDLADLIEHVQSRATPDTLWDEVPDRLTMLPAERHRLAAARRLFSLFWVVVLWRQRGQPDERLAAQIERARALGADRPASPLTN